MAEEKDKEAAAALVSLLTNLSEGFQALSNVVRDQELRISALERILSPKVIAKC